MEEKSRTAHGVAADYSTDEEEDGGEDDYETADDDDEGVSPESVVVRPGVNPYGAPRPMAPSVPQVEASVHVHAQDDLMNLKRELALAQAEHAAASSGASSSSASSGGSGTRRSMARSGVALLKTANSE